MTNPYYEDEWYEDDDENYCSFCGEYHEDCNCWHCYDCGEYPCCCGDEPDEMPNFGGVTC